ncbi:dihydrofolate reductase family protein [Geodermatophilus sp. URMC 64]
MGRIVSSFFIALDGVVEAPNEWHFPYFDDEMGRVVGESMQTTRAMLMGRRLYDEWSAYWPSQGDDVPFASHINGLPKYVLTHRPIEGPLWSNTTVLGGEDAVRRVQDLKNGTDGDIGMSGSATTVRWLLAGGLVDELNLLVHPIAVGRGRRLFEDTPTVPLELLGSRTLPTGVLHLRYAPKVSAGAAASPAAPDRPDRAPAG